MNIPDLIRDDVVLKFYGDRAAFAGIAVIDTYDIYDFDWDWSSIQSRTVDLMNRNGMMVWGCPQHQLQIRVSIRESSVPKNEADHASFLIRAQGTLCLCNYQSITMCAQYNDYKLPQPEDSVFTLPHGLYRASLYRMFDWNCRDQFVEALNEGDNYVLVFQPWSSGPETNDFKKIPWVGE
jgi:hypothetical protein